MSLILRTGFYSLKTRYFNAARAGWKAAGEAYSQQVSWQTEKGRLAAARKAAEQAFSQYLKSHDGHSTLKPLTSVSGQNEHIEKYERELLAALDTDKQPETRNIAISGAQGAGKSSFLRAFTERNPQHNYLHISLPARSDLDGSNETNSAKNRHATVFEAFDKAEQAFEAFDQAEQAFEAFDQAEQAAVKQLLCNISGNRPDGIEQQPGGWKKLMGVLAAFLTSVFIVATLSYISGNLTGNPGINQSTTGRALRLYLPDHLLAFTKKYAPLLAEFSLFFMATLLVLYLFIGLQKLGASRVSRITPLEKDNSATDNYLHQITHALARSRHNVVVVENLISSRQVQALSTLHRINRHLNDSGHIKQPVYFVYALADGILTARERTRFFDLIIPIIPIINAANAGARLYKQLETLTSDGQKVTDQMDKALIYKVAEYIDDMRVITNIVNEFDVYLDKLTSHLKELNKNRLFTMMVIKNLYPKEHAELTNDGGVFWKVFNQLPGHTVAEALSRGVMSDSFLAELSEARFGPVLYLLKNGYFAEDYRDYLSYFLPGAISEDDKRLSLRLGARQQSEFTHFEFTRKVDSPEALLNHLTPPDLANGQGLINAVVDYLLENPSSNYNGHSTHRFLCELFNLSENHFPHLQDFIAQYDVRDVRENNNHQKLLEAMFSINRELLIRCLTDGHSGGVTQAKLIASILPTLMSEELSDSSDTIMPAILPAIAALEDIQPIFRFVNEQPDIWTWLKNQPIKFHRLALRHCTQAIAFRLIEDSMYQLNSHMMGLLLAFSTEERPAMPAEISYSAVCSCGHHRLICQVHEHLNEFVKNILLAQPQLKEDQRYLVELLNAPKLETDDKVKLLKHSGQKVASIREILDNSLSLSVQLLENNLVAASWTNVQYIFKLNRERSVNPLLVNFIAIPENTEKLALQGLPNNQHTRNLLIALIHTEEFSDSTLNQLLSAFPAIFIEHLDPRRIASTRLKVIRQHPNCQFSFQSLDWLAQNENRFKADNTWRYLLRFWRDYQAKAESTAHLTVNTIVKLLSSNNIEINDKLWFCKLLNHENEMDSRLLAEMLSLITSQPAESFPLKISFNRLETLIKSAKTLSKKIRLVSQQVKYLSWPQVLTLLSRLNIEGTGQLTKDSYQFSLSNTKENLELINALRLANHIVVATSEDKQEKTDAYIKISSTPSI